MRKLFTVALLSVLLGFFAYPRLAPVVEAQAGALMFMVGPTGRNVVRGDVDGAIYTNIGGGNDLCDGTGSATVTAAALAGTCATGVREIIIQCDPGAASNCLVGADATPTMVVLPGGTLTIPVNALSKVFIRSVSGTNTYNWLARN